MGFNSLAFLVFLAATLVLYYRMGHTWQNRMLVAASYIFYGWWDWRFCGLLLFTTLFDYWCARVIEAEPRPARRKTFLAFSMTMNLAVIGFFKYFDFFADSFARALAACGMAADPVTLGIVLPVGISFYTFLSMSYTIDVYRGQLKAARSPLDFILYVSYFPHLVAGPIMRAKDLLPQCSAPRTPQQSQIITGVWLCLLGYLKKVVIADRLAPFVNLGFASEQPFFTDASSWLLLYAFAFQIYGDFSGYSDIARGLAKLMGFELVHNFKAPYLVSGPAAFWRNWHISLSVWLRDYLYIPLGGNQHGSWKTYRNLGLTMLLGGLWHGAGFAFVAWGLYHGALLVGQRAWLSLRDGADDVARPRWRRALGVVVFFHLTCLGWLLFRAGSVPRDLSQWQVCANLLPTLWKVPAALSPFAWPVFLLGGLALVVQWQHEAMDRFAEWSAAAQAAAVAATLAAITVLGVFEGSSFIYFQF